MLPCAPQEFPRDPEAFYRVGPAYTAANSASVINQRDARNQRPARFWHGDCVNDYAMNRFPTLSPRLSLSAALLALVLASPALAQGSTAIPEPADLALFALGVLGVLIGRRVGAN